MVFVNSVYLAIFFNAVKEIKISHFQSKVKFWILKTKFFRMKGYTSGHIYPVCLLYVYHVVALNWFMTGLFLVAGIGLQ